MFLEDIHSEYIYGKCETKHKRLMAVVHKNHIEILGKLIVRVSFFN